MPVKVFTTEQYKSAKGTFTMCKGKLVLVKVPHGNFPVPHSELYYCDFTESYHNGKTRPNGSEVSIQQDCCYAIKPVIISEGEKVKEGDNIACHFQKDICDFIEIHSDYQLAGGHNCCKKILAMTENLPEDFINNILIGNIKDGDEILLECGLHQYDEIIGNGMKTIKEEVIALNEKNKVTIWSK